MTNTINNICGIYFSGTGNTRWVMEKIAKGLEKRGIMCSLINCEKWNQEHLEVVRKADFIIWGFPIYGSMPPVFMREFFDQHQSIFQGKQCAVIATQLLFSGDGSAYFGRILRKAGLVVLDMEHFNMPSNLSDADIFKIKNGIENAKKLQHAKRKINRYVDRITAGRYKRVGDQPFSRGLGLLQRGGFRATEKKLQSEIKIDQIKCTQCKACIKCCPTYNIIEKNNQIQALSQCTLCYRCINLCPQKAISLMTIKKPTVQYKGPKMV